MNIKTIIIYTVIIVLFLGGLIFFSRTGQGEESGQAAAVASLVSTPDNYDFGQISMAKGTVSQNFSLKNTGDKPITITKISTSCMCTEATLVNGSSQEGPYGMEGHGGFVPTIKQVIEPGAEAQLTVAFDPAAHGPSGVGKVDRVVFIRTTTGEARVGFSATVTP